MRSPPAATAWTPPRTAAKPTTTSPSGMPDVIVGDGAVSDADGLSLADGIRAPDGAVPIVLTGPTPAPGRHPGVQVAADPLNLGLASRLA